MYLIEWFREVLRNMSLIPFKNVLLQQSAYYLNAESTTFLLLCFLSLRESTCETRKIFFYFTSKTITMPKLDIQIS